MAVERLAAFIRSLHIYAERCAGMGFCPIIQTTGGIYFISGNSEILTASAQFEI